MRLESNVAPRILTVSENWITESSNLTEERLDIVFKRCDVSKRMVMMCNIQLKLQITDVTLSVCGWI